MITKEQNEMIEYLIQGESISAIAKELNKARTTIYAWLKLDEIEKELKNRKLELLKSAKEKINSNVDICINNLLELANNSNDQRVKLQANKYLLDRVLGTPSIAKEDDINGDEENKDTNKLMAEIEEIKRLRAVK